MWPVRIREHECGLLFRDDRFVRALLPGTYWIWRAWRTRIVKITRLEPHVSDWLAELLLQDDRVRGQLEVVELDPCQRGLIWNDDRLVCVIGQGRHVFWASPKLQMEVRDISEVQLEHPRLNQIVRHAAQTTLFSVITLARDEQLEIFDNEDLVETLGPGTHVLWQGPRSIRWQIVPKREISAAEPARSHPAAVLLEPKSDKPAFTRGNLRV